MLNHHSDSDLIELFNCGTYLYMSPEIAKHKPLDSSLDIWALGIILYILISGGKHPFYSPLLSFSSVEYLDTLSKLKKWDFIKMKANANINKLSLNLFKHLCQVNKNLRYDCLLALQHPFITNNKKSTIPVTLLEKYQIKNCINQFKKIFLTMSIVNTLKTKLKIRTVIDIIGSPNKENILNKYTSPNKKSMKSSINQSNILSILNKSNNNSNENMSFIGNITSSIIYNNDKNNKEEIGIIKKNTRKETFHKKRCNTIKQLNLNNLSNLSNINNLINNPHAMKNSITSNNQTFKNRMPIKSNTLIASKINSKFNNSNQEEHNLGNIEEEHIINLKSTYLNNNLDIRSKEKLTNNSISNNNNNLPLYRKTNKKGQNVSSENCNMINDSNLLFKDDRESNAHKNAKLTKKTISNFKNYNFTHNKNNSQVIFESERKPTGKQIVTHYNIDNYDISIPLRSSSTLNYQLNSKTNNNMDNYDNKEEERNKGNINIVNNYNINLKINIKDKNRDAENISSTIYDLINNRINDKDINDKTKEKYNDSYRNNFTNNNNINNNNNHSNFHDKDRVFDTLTKKNGHKKTKSEFYVSSNKQNKLPSLENANEHIIKYQIPNTNVIYNRESKEQQTKHFKFNFNQYSNDVLESTKKIVERKINSVLNDSSTATSKYLINLDNNKKVNSINNKPNINLKKQLIRLNNNNSLNYNINDSNMYNNEISSLNKKDKISTISTNYTTSKNYNTNKIDVSFSKKSTSNNRIGNYSRFFNKNNKILGNSNNIINNNSHNVINNNSTILNDNTCHIKSIKDSIPFNDISHKNFVFTMYHNK